RMSEPIDLTTFDFHDLTLTRDGGPNLSGAEVTVTFVAGTTYRIGNLAGLTENAGNYTLTIIAATIESATGHIGAGSAATSWIVDMTPPTVHLTSQASDPTNSVPISVTMTFSEDIVGFAGNIMVSNGLVKNFTAVSHSK